MSNRITFKYPPTSVPLQLIVPARLVLLLRGAARRWHVAAAVQFAGDGVGDVAELLLLLLKVFGRGCRGVLLEPLSGFFDGFKELREGSAYQ